ncbi:MAG: hypothetical protein ACOCSD_08680 [Halolamina sp.]
MSDEPTTDGTTGPESTDTDGATERPETTEASMTDDSTHETEDQRGRDVWRTLNYGLLAGLALLALIATLQLYFNVSSAINQWITHEYRSLFQAAFNLAVLLLVSAGIVWQMRRLRE